VADGLKLSSIVFMLPREVLLSETEAWDHLGEPVRIAPKGRFSACNASLGSPDAATAAIDGACEGDARATAGLLRVKSSLTSSKAEMLLSSPTVAVKDAALLDHTPKAPKTAAG
jgi:hypothetical protein